MEFLSCTQIFHYEQRPLSGLVDKQIFIPWNPCTAHLAPAFSCLFSSPLHTGHVQPLLSGELIPGQGSALTSH